MERCVHLIAAIVSGALAVSGYAANSCTGGHEADKSAIGAGLGSLVGAGVDTLSSSKKGHSKGALVDAAAGIVLDDGVGYYVGMQEAELRNKTRGTGASVTRNGDNIILSMPNSVTFDSSSATLEPAGINTLTDVVMVPREYPGTAVNVIGYTDSTGGHDLNMCPLQQHVDSVVSALITQGVDANRIRTQDPGPANPITSNSAAEGKT